MKRLDRYPTVAEVAASYLPPLAESYWWATGWGFNRPVMARIGVGAHVREGAYVWIEVGDNCPIGGYKIADLERAGIRLSFIGPIPFPTELFQPDSQNLQHGGADYATAAQRAEAYLKTIGKWEDSQQGGAK